MNIKNTVQKFIDKIKGMERKKLIILASAFGLAIASIITVIVIISVNANKDKPGGSDINNPVCQHSEVTDNGTAPTCTEPGISDGKHCIKCGIVLLEQEILLPTGHKEATTEGKAATCTESGLSEGKHCSECGKILKVQSLILPLEHEKVTDKGKTPTCTEEGLSEGQHCAVCKKVLKAQETLPIIEHNEAVLEGKAPTCTEEGLSDGLHCSVCKTIFKAQEPLPIADHNFNGGNTCIDCGYRESIGLIYTLLPDGTYAVSGIGTCNDTEIIIPEKYEGIYVTAIGTSAFKNQTGLISIEIPNTVTAIGVSSFQGCIKLANITLPGSVTEIGASAFQGCMNLKSASIPEGIIKINNSTFNYCTALETVVIPKTLKEFGDYAFAFCSSLKTIEIPEGLIKIGSRAFLSCRKLENLTLNDKLKEIGNYAFSGCSEIKEIKIPDSVISIGNYAFSECSALRTVFIGKGMTSIGSYIFSSCHNLKSVSIEETMTSVEISAFDNCFSLVYNVYEGANYLGNEANPYIGLISAVNDSVVSVSVNGKTKFINKNAFEKCKYMTSVVIPDSVSIIGDDAFLDCNSLEYNVSGNIKYLGNPENPYLWLMQVMDTSLESFIINDKTVFIYKSAFEGCSKLVSITIPENIIFIEDAAFEGCERLAVVTNKSALDIEVGSSDFGKVAYYAKTVITDENENAVIEYGDYTFCKFGEYYYLIGYHGAVTETLILPGNINGNSYIIAGYAFSEYFGIVNIVIPSGVTAIEKYAFYGCSDIKSITLSETVASVEPLAFAGCSGIESITVNEANLNYHSAGNCLIETGSKILVLGCSLSVIPDDGSVTSIGDYAFAHCEYIESLVIPRSVLSIGIGGLATAKGYGSIKFINWVGWYVTETEGAESGTDVTSFDILNNPIELLTSTYRDMYWYKKA